MKVRNLFFSSFVSLALLTGCSEGNEIVGKLNELLDQFIGNSEEQGEVETTDADVSSSEAEAKNTEETEIERTEEDKEQPEQGTDEATEVITSEQAEIDPETYEDEQGNLIDVAYGGHAFVSRVVEHTIGDPAPSEQFSDPTATLGEPDYDGSTGGYLSLGGGGEVILEFENVYLIDGPGHDLQIFEIGPSVEALAVEISVDGTNWISVGEISGGTASIDIEPYISPGDQFSYVKLIDLFTNSSGDTPGADVDAVVAIHAALK